MPASGSRNPPVSDFPESAADGGPAFTDSVMLALWRPRNCASGLSKFLQGEKESAAIRRMKSSGGDPQVFIVIQQGGSSREYYPHSFFDRGSAIAYIRDANRAAYPCLGPFSISLPEIGALAGAAGAAVVCLREAGCGKKRATVNLKRALKGVRRYRGHSGIDNPT
jgi:hypothetical protein